MYEKNEKVTFIKTGAIGDINKAEIYPKLLDKEYLVVDADAKGRLTVKDEDGWVEGAYHYSRFELADSPAIVDADIEPIYKKGDKIIYEGEPAKFWTYLKSLTSEVTGGYSPSDTPTMYADIILKHDLPMIVYVSQIKRRKHETINEVMGKRHAKKLHTPTMEQQNAIDAFHRKISRVPNIKITI